jgi:hypothetical protein
MSTILFPLRPGSRATATGSTTDTDLSFSDALIMDTSLTAPRSVNVGHLAQTQDPSATDPSVIDTGPTGGIVPASETVTLAGSQLVFVNTYLSGVTDAYRTAVLYAEHELESHFSNNVTITVSFGFADLSSTGFLAQNHFNNQVQATYTNLRSALQTHATTPDDFAAVNSLPAADPSNGVGYLVGGGLARLLQLPGAGTSSLPDVQLVLGNEFIWNFDPNNRGADLNGYDAIGAIEHEISEGGFGRVGGLGDQNHTWGPMDLFRYSSAGHRDYTDGRDGLAAYFSVDGNQMLTPFHNSASSGVFDGQDPADWDIGGDSFGFGGKGVVGLLSSVDLRVLDILGWTPTGSTPSTVDDFRNSLTDTSHPFGSVAINGSSTGTLEVAGDRDWFQVQLTAGTPYLITVLGQQGGGGTLEDSYLRVHNNVGTLLAENDDIVLGINRDSQLTFTPTTSGTYYLDIGAYNDGYAGTYRVSVGATPSDDFRNSLTDTTHPFGSVAVNGSSAGTLEINGDRDWFQVQLAAGASYVINLQGAQAGGGTLVDPYLRVHDNAGTLLAENDDIVLGVNRDSQLTFTATAAGTYYLEAGAFDDSYTGTYRLSLSAANHAPVLTVPSANVTATVGQVIAASSLFSATDADNDPLTYYLYDNTIATSSGHFVVNGTIVPNDTMYAVTAAQLAQTTFVAGASGTSDDLNVKVYDGHVYTNWGEFHVNVPNHAPVLTVPSANVTAIVGQVIAASSLFIATDADNDPLTYYLYDNTIATSSGHFVVNGTIVPNDTMYAVTAAQLAQTTFVAGASGTSDDLNVKVYDGHVYTNWGEFHVNVPNHAPILTVPSANVAANAGQVLQASSLFIATDADHDPLTYYLYDNTIATSGGHFVVNGAVVPNDTMYAVTAAQLAQTTFVAGASGTSDDLNVKVYDGHVYTNWGEFHVNVNHTPVVTVPSANVAANAGQSLAASSLFSATDADNDPLTYYLYDNTVATSGGHFVVNGTIVPPDTMYAVTAAQLAQTSFVAGAATKSDDLFVKVFDGHVYTAWSEFHVNVANHASVVTVPSANVSANPGQAFAASSLFSATDADGDVLTYYLYDNTVATSGGHFTVNGTVVPSDSMYAVGAAQLGLTTFVAGGAGASDDLNVKVFDGHAYTNWNEFHVNVTGANHAPTVTSPPANVSVNAGQVLQISSLFSATDIDGDTLTYYVYDNTVATSGGHFALNGATIPSDTLYPLSAAQFLQTTFVAGAAGKSDDLNIKVFDGHTYTNWSEFHVNASGAGANHIPSVTAPLANVPAVGGQVLQLSSLFSATDLDGDALTYYVYDNTVATSGGHFALNGTTIPSDTIYPLTAAQFAQATFVAGHTGTNDDLNIKVFDGHVYTSWAEFHVVV